MSEKLPSIGTDTICPACVLGDPRIRLCRVHQLKAEPPSDALPREVQERIEAIALAYHKATDGTGEGEYGCPGVACPGVQRLVQPLSTAYRLGLAQHAGEIARLREALEAIIENMDDDCPMCDRGRLRNPNKTHWPECPFGKATALLAELR